MSGNKLVIRVSNKNDLRYVQTIVNEIELASTDPSTSILKRSPQLIASKLENGEAIIAVTKSGTWVGFCYLQLWSEGKFVANCGLVVAPAFRRIGVANLIKKQIVALSREIYPQAKLFGLTTSLAVMKINSDLGYKPVTYSEITTDTGFWAGCRNCPNHAILEKRKGKNCLCTAMLFETENALQNI
ncbi:MAG: N-acetyltransferase [Flavisolibacter sp.]